MARPEDVLDPYLGESFQNLGALAIESRRACLTLGYPAQGLKETLAAEFPGYTLELEFEPPRLSQQPGKNGLPGVKNILTVASGKGGVGKSTTAVNLALALSREGARVGLLDADIYGPSLGLMLGVPEDKRPEVIEEKFFKPISVHGIQANSMSFLVTENTPMVWRGPMASGALQQLLMQTRWEDLDYLLVDMPPGTGDIQLTLSQQVPVAGAVIVTTPQDIALMDAIKGIEMFRKVDIPVLGIVENMSVHICPECGHASHIFGSGGGAKVAQQYHTSLLGALPLSMDVRQQIDSGRPPVAADPESEISRIYRDVARRAAAELWQLSRSAATPPIFSVADD